MRMKENRHIIRSRQRHREDVLFPLCLSAWLNHARGRFLSDWCRRLGGFVIKNISSVWLHDAALSHFLLSTCALVRHLCAGAVSMPRPSSLARCWRSRCLVIGCLLPPCIHLWFHVPLSLALFFPLVTLLVSRCGCQIFTSFSGEKDVGLGQQCRGITSAEGQSWRRVTWHKMILIFLSLCVIGDIHYQSKVWTHTSDLMVFIWFSQRFTL